MKLIKKLKIKNFMVLFFAGIINSVGVTVFLQPVRLYDSGISGTSMFLSQITPQWLSLSVFLVVLNIPIFIFGAKKQGIEFTIYSVFVVAIYSLSAWLITDVLPIDVASFSPLAKDDLFLCAIFGGLISGIGSGLAIRFGGDCAEINRQALHCKTIYFTHPITNEKITVDSDFPDDFKGLI